MAPLVFSVGQTRKIGNRGHSRDERAQGTPAPADRIIRR
jgi:hypothetical protein